MFSVDVKTTVGDINVQTTQNKGLSPEYWTERIMERLISISDNATPEVKAQAQAFKDNIVGFKTTLITPDRIDTPLSHSRESWTGNGIDTKDIGDFIEWCIQTQDNTVIEEVVLCVNLDYKA